MKCENAAKVSVCIPTYNYAHFLPDAINSVLSQTCQDFDLLIIDNCSTDDTKDVAGKFELADIRIRYYCNESNVGLVGNLNRCLELAKGEYVKILCADDMLEPDSILRCLKAFANNPTVTLVATARLLVDKDSSPIGSVAFSDRPEVLSGHDVIRKCLFAGNLIGEPTAVMFRRKDCKRLFNLKYKQLIDLEMWFYLLERGDFAFIPERLCKFRCHENQATWTNVDSLAFINDEVQLHNDYIEKSYIGKTFLNEQRWKSWITYNIWKHKRYGLDKETIQRKIEEFSPLYVFYLNLFVRTILGKIHSTNKLVKRVFSAE